MGVLQTAWEFFFSGDNGNAQFETDTKVALGERPYKDRAATGVVDDEQLTNDLQDRAFGTPTRLKLGKISYAQPFTNSYKVQVDDTTGTRIYSAMSQKSVTPLGVRELGTYAPYSTVLVGEYEGVDPFIIGVVPDHVSDSKVTAPDYIEQGSGVGFNREQYYHGLLSKCDNNADIKDFSNGSPVDSTCVGEWGAINDLGMGFALDPFMSFMRVDEASGLFMYYYDRFVRLAAYNFRLETAGTEWDSRNDSGEVQDIRRATPYPWEALGIFDKDTAPHVVNDDFEVQYEKPIGKHEAYTDEQQAFYRSQEFRGYLGQGGMRQLCLPPVNPPERNTYSGEEQRVGVFREQLGLDGSYGLISAHSVHIGKRMLIPIPKRKKVWEDAGEDGDDIETGNYMFAGLFGEGEPHVVTDSVEAGTDLPHLQTAAGLLDVQAHLYNWKGLHAFQYHKGDYLTPEESELSYATKLQATPRFSELASSTWMSRPDPVSEIDVDHRYAGKNYYENQSGIDFLPDGGVVLRDGYGSEIRMTGGNVTISAPGDIWRQSGRSCVDWAGDDAIIKARNSVDITSSEKDVRIKAEYNAEILAGNNGKQGRLLLDNQATSISHDYTGKIGEEIDAGSGIILKAKNSQVVAMSKNIYMRTGNSDGEIGQGTIVLDAAKGEANIYTNCDLFERKMTSAIDGFFSGGEAPTVLAANYYSDDWAILGSALAVSGQIINTKDGIITRGSVYSEGGKFATTLDGESNRYVLKVDGPFKGLGDVEKSVEQIKDSAQNIYDADINDIYYIDGAIGSATVQKNCMFSPRNEEQYATADFKLPQTYFQLLAGSTGGGLTSWTENEIVYQSDILMPYPGKEAWKTQEAFYEYAHLLYDVDAQCDKDRSDSQSDYETPVLKDWEKKKLDGNYKVLSM